jgi:hypothetical protein
MDPTLHNKLCISSFDCAVLNASSSKRDIEGVNSIIGKLAFNSALLYTLHHEDVPAAAAAVSEKDIEESLLVDAVQDLFKKHAQKPPNRMRPSSAARGKPAYSYDDAMEKYMVLEGQLISSSPLVQPFPPHTFKKDAEQVLSVVRGFHPWALQLQAIWSAQRPDIIKGALFHQIMQCWNADRKQCTPFSSLLMEIVVVEGWDASAAELESTKPSPKLQGMFWMASFLYASIAGQRWELKPEETLAMVEAYMADHQQYRDLVLGEITSCSTRISRRNLIIKKLDSALEKVPVFLDHAAHSALRQVLENHMEEDVGVFFPKHNYEDDLDRAEVLLQILTEDYPSLEDCGAPAKSGKKKPAAKCEAGAAAKGEAEAAAGANAKGEAEAGANAKGEAGAIAKGEAGANAKGETWAGAKWEAEAAKWEAGEEEPGGKSSLNKNQTDALLMMALGEGAGGGQSNFMKALEEVSVDNGKRSPEEVLEEIKVGMLYDNSDEEEDSIISLFHEENNTQLAASTSIKAAATKPPTKLPQAQEERLKAAAEVLKREEERLKAAAEALKQDEERLRTAAEELKKEEERLQAEAEEAAAEEERLRAAEEEERRKKEEASKEHVFGMARLKKLEPSYKRVMVNAMVPSLESVLFNSMQCFLCLGELDFVHGTDISYLTCCDGGSFACSGCVRNHGTDTHTVAAEKQIVVMVRAIRKDLSIGMAKK